MSGSGHAVLPELERELHADGVPPEQLLDEELAKFLDDARVRHTLRRHAAEALRR